MKTFTAEEAIQDLSKLITLAQEENSHFRIVSEEGAVVLLSEETYQNLMVTLELLSTPGLINGLKCFKRSPIEVVSLN